MDNIWNHRKYKMGEVKYSWSYYTNAYEYYVENLQQNSNH